MRSILLLLCCSALAWGEEPVRLTMLDGETRRPVAGAGVTVSGTLVAVADSAGIAEFAAPSGEVVVTVTAVGHDHERLLLREDSRDDVTIYLRPRVIDLASEVLVYGVRLPDVGASYEPADGRTSTEAMLNAVGGVEMIRRANYALDPSVRGTHGGQVGVAIDGMKVFRACVDQMDPVTGYVENENLETFEVAKGAFDLTQGQAIGGSINLVTRRPRFGRSVSLDSEVGVESASRHRYSRSSLNLARGDVALRGSFSYRNADDFRPGGREALANTQYAKYNFKVDASRKLGAHQINAGILGDRAWDIGYPALLMDATRAQSRLYSLEHTWSGHGRHLHTVTTRLYHSRVDHWMDDYDRDVGAREVMRGMNMPMYGKTRTWGVLETLELSMARRTLKLVVDYYLLEAFADMQMVSLDPQVAPNYLINVGKARRHHLAIAGDYNQALSSRWQLRSGLRLDLATQSLNDPVGRRNLQATWGDGSLDRRYLTLSASSTLERELREDLRLKLGLAASSRLPTQLESYGFFLFNPSDGYFYTGRPSLKPERTQQVEIGVEHRRDRRQLALSAYYSRLTDYIAGVVQESVYKTYANISAARIYGFEMDFRLPLSHGLAVAGGSSYIRGSNLEFDEPLPFIAPWEGRLRLSYERSRYRLEGGLRAVARQGRVARRTTLEDPTPGFVLFDARTTVALSGRWDIRMGIENLADRFYHEHNSINNLPSPGRNYALAIAMGI